jgi:hypothetical protein
VRRRITESRLGQTTLIASAAALVAVALAVAAPSSSIRPALTGSLAVGRELTSDKGTWAGSASLTYTFKWHRCDPSGSHCKTIPGATGDSYSLGAADGGRTIGLTVHATDSTGAKNAYSSLVGPVSRSLVYATAAPKLSGGAEVGHELQADAGSWSATPQSLTYQWLRCNRNGRICSPIGGATTAGYKPAVADVGHALVAQLTAKVGTTAQAAFSTATTPVAAEGDSLPAGATPLRKGRYSIPIESVSLPARLVVAGVSYAKGSLTVRVTDSRGYAIRGALVQVSAPYGYVARVKETPTGKAGDAVVALKPKAWHPRAVVLYVRARKAGDDVLAGVTASRLVSVRPTTS